jgi:hypothetical protein
MFILPAAAALAAVDNQLQSEPPSRADVLMSRTVILPRANRTTDTVSVRPEEVMWTADLAVEDVAHLSAPIHAEAGGLSRDFTPTSALWRSEPKKGLLDGQPFKGKLYCGVRLRKGRVDNSEIFELIFRSDDWERWDSRLCLLDEDEDGSFDHAVAVGKINQGPVKAAIAPIPYTQFTDMPVPNASVQFRPIKGGMLQGPQIELDGYAGGRKIGAAALHMLPAGRSKFERVFGERSIPKETFPTVLNFGDMQITVTAYDGSTRTVTARLDKGFYRTPVYFEGPGPTIITIYH